MIKAKFKLKSPSSLKETSIRLISYIDGERLLFGTDRSIFPELWDFENERPISQAKQKTKYKSLISKYKKSLPQIEAFLSNLNNRLNRIEGTLISFCTQLEAQGIRVTKQACYDHLDSVFNEQKKPEGTTKPLTLSTYIKKFYDEIESGERLHKNKRYQDGTLKNYRGFIAQFKEYQKETKRVLDFDDITMDFYDSFLSFFNKKNYSPNTIGRHVKNLKTIMKAAREEKLHTNMEIDRRAFVTPKIATDEIYLNESEIKALYNLDLKENPELELSRDVFLVGCYIAQRFSDYSRIRPHHIQVMSGGHRVLNMITKKTQMKVIIPIRYELEQILSKYEYHVPKIAEQTLNRNIKKVGQKAKITEVVEVEMQRGSMTIKKTVPKCELIKTHTARRSGATNMYLAGIPTLEIMKITGHTSEANLLKYIKATKEETAIKLSSHSYFNNQLKVS